MEICLYGIILAVFLLLAVFFVRGAINLAEIKKQSFDRVLILGKEVLFSGLLGFVLFPFPTVACIIEKESIWSAFGFALLCLLGLLLIIAWQNCRIFYNHKGDTFTVLRLSGKADTYSYSDVTEMTGFYGTGGDVRIYANEKMILIDMAHEGRKKFIKLVRRKYKELHDGQPLEITARRKRTSHQKTEENRDNI